MSIMANISRIYDTKFSNNKNDTVQLSIFYIFTNVMSLPQQSLCKTRIVGDIENGTVPGKDNMDINSMAVGARMTWNMKNKIETIENARDM